MKFAVDAVDTLRFKKSTALTHDGIRNETTQKLEMPNPHMSRAYFVFFERCKGLSGGSPYQGCSTMSVMKPLAK